MSVDLTNHMGSAMKSAGLPGTNTDNTKVALGPSYPTGVVMTSPGGNSNGVRNSTSSGILPVGASYNMSGMGMKKSRGSIKSGND